MVSERHAGPAGAGRRARPAPQDFAGTIAKLEASGQVQTHESMFVNEEAQLAGEATGGYRAVVVPSVTGGDWLAGRRQQAAEAMAFD